MKQFIKLFTILFGWFAFGQIPTITLENENFKTNPVVLEDLKIDVEIFGNIAQTSFIMRFYNSSSRNLEANLTFPLPNNSNVVSYALDINGKMREAVSVEKERAAEIFESIQKQNIDPGILEKVDANNFRTRISPIMGKQSRTVKIVYQQILSLDKEKSYEYYLPLDYKNQLKKFQLQTKVYHSSIKPILLESPSNEFVFSENSQVFEANFTKNDFLANQSMKIKLPKKLNSSESFIQKNGDDSFVMINAFFNNPTTKKVWNDEIALIWDNSLSGKKRNHLKEFEFLDELIRHKKNLSLELITLNTKAKKHKTYVIKNADWSQLKTDLEQMDYDGGTDISQLQKMSISAKEALFFTDGLSTFGKFEVNLKVPTTILVSSQSVNYNGLDFIAKESLGKLIDLNFLSVKDAFEKASSKDLNFVGIKEEDFKEVYVVNSGIINENFTVFAKMLKSTKKLTLQFCENGKEIIEIPIVLENKPIDVSITNFWAQQKVNQLEFNYNQNREIISQLAKRFNLVTNHHSLMVLENVEDYVKYKIDPPKELEEEYWVIMKNRKNELIENRKNILQNAISKAAELRNWWKFGNQIIDKKLEENLSLQDISLEEVQRSPQASYRMNSPANAEMAMVANVNAEGKMMTESENSPSGKIILPDLKSDKEYIKILEKTKDPYAYYLTIKDDFMGTPSFFLDVSDYFYRKNDKEKAVLILSNLAELDIQNSELYKIILYKLKEYQEYETELWIAEQILAWRPFDAQSYRDYALALLDNDQPQKALNFLNKILENDYSEEIAARDYGIEEVIVTEINHIRKVYKNVDDSKISKDLLMDIPVDVRVVLNWNKDLTDIDLWVTDPDGDRCWYQNTRTKAGGRISQDITQGFGPEQFMLKKAKKGKYKIETNFFAERQMNLSGPTTVMAEIYLYYASGKVERKIQTFQLAQANQAKDALFIGEFEF